MKTTPTVPALSPAVKAMLKPYQTVINGEVVSAINYFQGQPLNVRFNGQTGRFSIDGQEDLGTCLEIVPIAWRFFRGELFNRASADYAEVFYVDKQRNLCVVLFTNTSVSIFRKFIANLKYSAYGGQSLLNTVVRISASPRKNEKTNGKYHVAEFTNCGPADVRATTAFFIFCQDHKVYRAETRTAEVEDILWSTTYFTMIGTGVKRDVAVREQ